MGSARGGEASGGSGGSEAGLVSSEAAVARARAAFAGSKPLVLRGCAAGIPAIRTVRNDSLLRSLPGGSRLFAPLLSLEAPADANGPLEPVGAWEAHWTWPSAISDELRRWSAMAGGYAPMVWVSRGGKDAAMHYDTVDNYHVVVGDAPKSFEVPTQGAHTLD